MRAQDRIRNLMAMVIFILLPISISRAGTFEYHFSFKPDGYDLTLKMTFPPGATLNQVRNNFRNEFLFREFNPNIKSMELSSYEAKDYRMTMGTQSFGINSTLVSECHETESPNSLWNRHCILQTEIADGGQFMIAKTDTTFCQVNPNTKDLTCRLDITGKAKPVKVLGLTLMNERSFTLRAKESAIRHFVPLWIYGHQGSFSSTRAKELFEEVGFRQSIEDAFTRARKQDQDDMVSLNGTFELPVN